MKTSMMRYLLPCIVVLGLAVTHCGGGDSGTAGSTGGSAGTGGSAARGGSAGTSGAGGGGGSSATGGSGGISGQGGSGGISGQGGTSGTGGAGGTGGGSDAGTCPSTPPMDGDNCTGMLYCPYDSESCICGGGGTWSCFQPRDGGNTRDTGGRDAVPACPGGQPQDGDSCTSPGQTCDYNNVTCDCGGRRNPTWTCQ